MLKRKIKLVHNTYIGTRKLIRRLIITDQPGRYIAVFVISPILAKKGFEYNDIFIQLFSLLLFTWDLFWIIIHPAKEIKSLKQN
jgi:hypothetical protein